MTFLFLEAVVFFLLRFLLGTPLYLNQFPDWVGNALQNYLVLLYQKVCFECEYIFLPQKDLPPLL